MQEKYHYNELLKEFPEHEKDIKDSFGYQVETIRKNLDVVIGDLALALNCSKEDICKFASALAKIPKKKSFIFRIKRFFKMIFNKIKDLLTHY